MNKIPVPNELHTTAKNFLQKSSFFSCWTETELDAIIRNTQMIDYEDGETIFTPDDTRQCLYLVMDGTVEIISPDKADILAEFVTGNLFGEISLLQRKPQQAFALARNTTQLIEFPKDGMPLEELYQDSPEILAHLFKTLLIFTAQRTRAANTLIKENSPMMRELRNQVYKDKLTGLYNRTYLHESFSELKKNPFTLIMMKPDNFKYINDTFGHEAGDAALIFMGTHLKKTYGKDTVLVRYEGNEFAVLSYLHTKKEDAYTFAQTIKTKLETIDISRVFTDKDDSGSVFLSMSLGVVLYPEHGDTEELITRCSGIPLTARKQGGSTILFPEDCPC